MNVRFELSSRRGQAGGGAPKAPPTTLERRSGHCPGRIERRGERSAICVSRRGPEERRRAAKHSAHETAHNRARAGEKSRNRLAGSTHEGADRRHGSPGGVDRALHDNRFLCMNDDLTTLVMVGVVAIAGRVMIISLIRSHSTLRMRSRISLDHRVRSV